MDWREPGQDLPTSSNGIACLAPDGTLLELPTWPDGTGIIADCDALNVMGQGAWTCSYTEFPLVHFAPGDSVRWWRNALSELGAIAIDGHHALVAGGYKEEASRLVLVALDGAGQGETVRPLGSWMLPLRRLPPSANEWASIWEHPTLLTGTGDALHLVDDNVWSRWRVADLIAST